MADNDAGANGVLIEAMERLGVAYEFDYLSRKYFAGESTQIPANPKITSKDSRFTRKIALSKHSVNEAR